MPVGLAFIVGQLSLGGAEQQLYHLLSSLDRSRFRAIVITLGPTSDEYWVQQIRRLGISVWHVKRSLGRAGRVIKIWKILCGERVSLIHGWDLHTNPYSALAGRMARIPLRIGSMRLNYCGIPDERLIRWIGYRGLDVLVTNSATAARQVEEYQLTKAKVRIVANGVEIPDPTTDLDRRRLKLELGFSENDRLIGSIGRLDSNKNHAMLLRVFVALANTLNTLRLVIIGDGPLKSHIATLIEELGVSSKVRLPGAIPGAAGYLPAMEVCCLTSYTEGMPNLIMEASAAGVPVVSTTCGDSAELIEHGVTGYLVSPDDDSNMSGYVQQLLGHSGQCHSMGQAGRQKMSREFSIEEMVAGMTQVYEESLAEINLI